MRFQSRGKSGEESLVRSQRRMTFVVVGIGLVVVLLSVTGKSSFFTDLFSNAPATVPQPPAISESLLSTNSLRSDEFRVVPTEANEIASKYSSLLDKEGIAEMESSVQTDVTGAAIVPAVLTRTIRDDVLGVLSSEMAAWFGTLRMSKNLTTSKLQSLPEAQYTLFMASPQSCRGRAFTLRGRLRRLTPFAIDQSSQSFGLKSAYDAWISTRDSGNQLVHVVAVMADPGLPNPEVDGVAAPDVEMTGYFFKREGYAAKGSTGEPELGLTALFLAGRIQYLPPQKFVSRAAEMTPWMLWIGIGVCCGVVVLVWQFQIADSRFRETRTHQLTTLPVRASFDDIEVRTIHEALQEMQDYARSSSPDTGLLT
ncbi:MAG: hypothetical protein H7Z17_15935 [Fuerstia sp.]|nr:hypothetical protein [Fuerstiella sp.]